MINTRIRVSPAPVNLADEYQWLAACENDGAVVTFTGKVRDYNVQGRVSALTLEHYPGMAEQCLSDIVNDARQRWSLQRVGVIHRIGTLYPGDDIVLVGASSAHRSSAFEAVQYIMDHLKMRAPFWKRETTAQGECWVVAHDADRRAVSRWE